MQRWLYHPELGSKVFKDKEIDEKRAQGWCDSPKLFPAKPIYAPLQPPEEIRDVAKPRRFFKGHK